MIDAGIIDANILLRLILDDIPAQVDLVERLFERIESGDVEGTVLPTIFLEIVFVLERQYQQGRERISDGLDQILALSGLRVVDRAQLLDAVVDYRRRPGVSFADAYHCAVARSRHGGAIVSFDRTLSGIDGVTRREPADVQAQISGQ